MWYTTSFLRNSPFIEFDKMRREFDSLFNSALSRPSIRSSLEVFPPISIAETGEDVRIYAFAPGFERNNFDISIQGSLLTISGKKEKSAEALEKRTCHRNERPYGEFTRTVTLNQSVDTNQVHASYENGILTVLVGKKAEVKPRKIEVKAQ